MHILVVHQYFLGKDDAGGSRWNQFSKYWSQAGHKITVVAGTVHYATGKKLPQYKGNFIFTEYDSERIVVKRCYVSESYNKSRFGRALGYASFALSSTIAGFLVEKPDILICTSPPLSVGLTGAILSKFRRIPLVFEVRDLWPEGPVDLGAISNKWIIKSLYWLQRLSYGSAKWINVLTPAFEKFLINVNGVSAGKISVISNGADLDIIKPGERNNWVREKHALGNKFIVTYVGAHGAANALTQLVNAAKILKDKDPEVQLMLVGAGMQKPRLVKEAKESGLTNITFVDPVPKAQIGDYINASDLCTAVLKKIEQFKYVYPNKLFDYMSAAKPVVIGVDGVARQLVEEACAGVFVEPENPQLFVEGVLKLKADSSLAHQMGQNGLMYVHKHFDREKLAERYLDILEKLVSNKKK
jgi:glycosyltransferase involved in cell wall biosynthesis